MAVSTPLGTVTFDDLFARIKAYGAYQLFFFVTVQYLCLPQAAHFIVNFYSLGGLAPSYICNDNDLKFNYSSKFVKANSEFVCQQLASCVNLTKHNAWHSIYDEYRLVCSSQHQLSTIASLLPLGVIVSYLTAGYLTDRFGRKWLMILGILIETMFGFGQAILKLSWGNYILFIVLNALLSPASLFSGAAYSLIMESVSSNYRLVQGCAFQFSIGYIFAGFLAYITRDWRLHLIVANTFAIPGLVMMLFIQESPRFLANKKQYDKAAEVMMKIARFNRRKTIFTAEEIKATQTENENKPTKKCSALDLFRSRKLAKYAFSQILTGIGMNIVGSILLYNMQDLSGNPLLNVVLMGVVRIWTPFVAIFLENGMSNFGRKKFLVLSQGLVCICFATMMLISIGNVWDKYHKIATGCALIGYGTEVGLVWFAYKLYTTELFPTAIRTTALNVFSTTSLIGSVLSPQLVYLTKFWHAAPYFGAALITLLATIFALLLLPETKGIPLPDTILEWRHQQQVTGEESPYIDELQLVFRKPIFHPLNIADAEEEDRYKTKLRFRKISSKGTQPLVPDTEKA